MKPEAGYDFIEGSGKFTERKRLKSRNLFLTQSLSISSGQRNLMKTYHNEANDSGITKIAAKNVSEFFG